MYKPHESWKTSLFSEKECQKKENFRKKRVKEEGRSYFRFPQKNECHSHIAPFDKKEWHSSFPPFFRSGAQEWRSKEWRSLTHWSKYLLAPFFYCSSMMDNFLQI